MFGRQSSEGIKLALKSASLVPGLGAKQWPYQLDAILSLPLLFGSLYCISCILDSFELCCISLMLLLRNICELL